MTTKAVPIPRLPRPKRGMRNRPGSSIGWARRFSTATQAALSATKATKLPTTPGWSHPYSGPWMRPKTRPPRARADSRLPGGSSGWPCVSREVGTRAATRTNSTTAMGTLTKKIEPHQKNSSSRPAARIPMAPPAPANPAQMAMARLRSSAGNTEVRMDRVAGMTRPAPMPMTQRHTMTWADESLVEPMTAPNTITVRPTSRAPRRPNRSPRAPNGRRTTARTRA